MFGSFCLLFPLVDLFSFLHLNILHPIEEGYFFFILFESFALSRP